MSVRVALDNKPEFYTNLDVISGRVVLGLNRSEQISSIVVKLEGEAVTALPPPRFVNPDDNRTIPPDTNSNPVTENHKILYKLQQVFPDDYYSSQANPYGAHPLTPGEHVFPFKFKLPINNACSDPMAMSKIGGLGGVGGFGSGGRLFGLGGVRVMDGSKQLFLHHVTQTLPPSLAGFPMEAEIRYFVKVTIQRPGLLKENWRFQVGFKFMPIEPPRPKVTGQESFARRPFTFRAPSPGSSAADPKKRGSFFSKKGSAEGSRAAQAKAAEARAAEAGPANTQSATAGPVSDAPSIEMSARLPHPSVLTCNKPVPLRLVAKKLVNCPGQVFLKSVQIDLIGITDIRSQTASKRRLNRWVVFTDANLDIPVCSPTDEVGKEVAIADDLWRNIPLPNTVAPSFSTCNLTRQYQLEIKLGLVWGKTKTSVFKGNNPFAPIQPQAIHLPLHFADVQVFSGITPPAELVRAARSTKPGRVTMSMAPKLPPRTNTAPPDAGTGAGTGAAGAGSGARPPQPPRPQNYVPVQPPTLDPMYPPQLGPGQVADDAPPSYDEAMAENLSGPFDGMNPRPAYSGVTDENAPSQMPEKS